MTTLTSTAGTLDGPLGTTRAALERPRPSDPGGDEDVPSERESETGREDSGRESGSRGEPSREPSRDPKE